MITIISDLSGVLIQGGTAGAKIAERELGIPAHKLLWNYFSLRNSYDRLLRGEISERMFWDIFINLGKLSCTTDQLEKCLRESISQTIPGTLTVYESIVACPDEIGCPHMMSYTAPQFILASDHCQDCIPFLKRIHPDIFRLFADTYFSCDIGLRKRDDARFLTRILYEHNLRPSEVVFVDDNPKNLRVARKIGITSIRFRSAKDLKNKLRHLGFEFIS